MNLRTIALTASLLQIAALPANADNAMGYRLLSPEAAAALPHNRGTLGVNIERAEQISDGGITFEVMRISQARRGFAGAQAGLKTGDEIIAVDGMVFPSLLVFAAYIGSARPGRSISIDYIPTGGGPQQAQRVTAIIGVAAPNAPPLSSPAPARQGMSTSTKVAIGVGAAALFGCYEMGCFSNKSSSPSQNHQPQAAPGTAGNNPSHDRNGSVP